MIRETNEKPKPGEIKAFTFAISHPMPIDKKGKKAMKATAEFASKLEGLLGVNVQMHPRKSQYVNMVEALHLWRPCDGDWGKMNTYAF